MNWCWIKNNPGPNLNIICVLLNTTATGKERDFVQKWLQLLSHSSDGAVKAYIPIIICHFTSKVLKAPSQNVNVRLCQWSWWSSFFMHMHIALYPTQNSPCSPLPTWLRFLKTAEKLHVCDSTHHAGGDPRFQRPLLLEESESYFTR